MGCSQSDFPITYLGMPLTVKKPTKQLFIPLIEKVEGRLQGWQSRLLSRGGRLLLTQTVLSSIPIYHMICFVLPKWVISRINRARRRFIWGNRGNDHRYISLCNWNLVCIPRRWGGLGIPDLHLRNISLIMRWWWKLYNEPESIWSVLISRIRWQGTYSLGPFLWSKQGSFFLVQLIGLKHIFNWCTQWEIGSGSTISFWYDHWGPYPLRLTGSRQQGYAISLAQALSDFNVMNLPPTHCLPSLTDTEDILRWRWTANGQYSANSLYVVMSSNGLIAWRFTEIWKYSIPPSVRVFLFLLLRDKLLTREVMQRRTFNCNGECVLCDSYQRESALHLFFQCDFSNSIWEGISEYLGAPILVNDESIELIWERSSGRFRGSQLARNRWRIFISAGCWAIWRQRNSLIF